MAQIIVKDIHFPKMMIVVNLVYIHSNNDFIFLFFQKHAHAIILISHHESLAYIFFTCYHFFSNVDLHHNDPVFKWCHILCMFFLKKSIVSVFLHYDKLGEMKHSVKYQKNDKIPKLHILIFCIEIHAQFGN